MTRRRLIILGSTGSIGVSALDVVEHLQQQARRASRHQGGAAPAHDFEVAGLAAGGSNVELLAAQAERFGVRHIAVADASLAPAMGGVERVYRGADSALELIDAVARPGDLVLGAMVGAAGIPATIAAIERGCDIALANKETLVAAGAIVMPLARSRGVTLLPVDSEHSAVFQCMACLRDADAGALVGPPSSSSVRRIVLTASGGPFRSWTASQLEHATVEQALNHPTWSMGRKITIDSASLMNKALEVIEAHWLFGLPAQQIEVIIHPQSIVHSFVELVDGSVMAQLGPPDMKTPIQLALTWPHRVEGCSKCMDWTALRNLEFEPVDHDRFPAIELAREAIGRGGTAGAILNAANEAAVAAFLDDRMPFTRIGRLVSEALQSLPVNPVASIDDVMRADRAARAFVQHRLHETAREPRPARTSAGTSTPLPA